MGPMSRSWRGRGFRDRARWRRRRRTCVRKGTIDAYVGLGYGGYSQEVVGKINGLMGFQEIVPPAGGGGRRGGDEFAVIDAAVAAELDGPLLAVVVLGVVMMVGTNGPAASSEKRCP